MSICKRISVTLSLIKTITTQRGHRFFPIGLWPTIALSYSIFLHFKIILSEKQNDSPRENFEAEAKKEREAEVENHWRTEKDGEAKRSLLFTLTIIESNRLAGKPKYFKFTIALQF